MGKLIRLANTKDITDGTMKKYQVQGTEILISRIEGKYYAAQNKCLHFGGDLSKANRRKYCNLSTTWLSIQRR